VKTNLLTNSFISTVTPVLFYFFQNLQKASSVEACTENLRKHSDFLLISRPNWDPPSPFKRRRVCNPQMGEQTRLREREGGPNPDEVYMDFVLIVFCYAVPRIKIFSLVRYCSTKDFRFREITKIRSCDGCNLNSQPSLQVNWWSLRSSGITTFSW
jgi:hypothetical protein